MVRAAAEVPVVRVVAAGEGERLQVAEGEEAQTEVTTSAVAEVSGEVACAVVILFPAEGEGLEMADESALALSSVKEALYLLLYYLSLVYWYRVVLL